MKSYYHYVYHSFHFITDRLTAAYGLNVGKMKYQLKSKY